MDGDARRSLIAEMFSGPMSREKTRATLKRALELLDGTKKKANPRARGRNYDGEAKALLHLMTGDIIGSTSAESNITSPVRQKPREDEDYCLPFMLPGSRRVLKNEVTRTHNLSFLD